MENNKQCTVVKDITKTSSFGDMEIDKGKGMIVKHRLHRYPSSRAKLSQGTHFISSGTHKSFAPNNHAIVTANLGFVSVSFGGNFAATQTHLIRCLSSGLKVAFTKSLVDLLACCVGGECFHSPFANFLTYL